jgi:hypothetical protein
MSIVYLCGAIAGCSDEECKLWRNYIKSKHQTCLDPMDRDYRCDDSDFEAIVLKDKADIEKCDTLLYNYLTPSVGSSMEVLLAYQSNKRVIIVDNGKKLSPWLKFHSHFIYNTIEEAVKNL